MSLGFSLILLSLVLINYSMSVNKMNMVKVYEIFLELKIISMWMLKLMIGFVVFLLLNYNSYMYFSVGVSMFYGEVLLLAFSLVLLSWIIWGINNLSYMLSHLLPMGIQGILKVFLPVLELVGMMIRPLTLGVRLATNISCGHVVLLMFSYFIFSVSEFLVISIFLVLLGLYLIEFLVCLIQAYVFWSLLYIYMMEIEI